MLRWSMLFCLFCCYVQSYAGDTLTVTITQADSVFLKKNLQLLASSLNVEIGKAQVIQAKLYPNPVFTADINFYDPENERFFNVGNSGQKYFQLDQLILLGGKRRSEIDMAKTNTDIAELELKQLLLQLKFRLRTDLFTSGVQRLLLERYNSQLSLLDTIMRGYQVQAERGNIPYKEVVRLKGAFLQLNNDRAALLAEFYKTQASLQTLLQTEAFIRFEIDEAEVEQYIKPFPLEEILAEAQQNSPLLLLTQKDKTLAQQYLQYSKRLAAPDLNVFTAYDQRSGAFNNQVNVGFSIPLPLWNRNQGNIKTAKIQLLQADYQIQSVQFEVGAELRGSFALYQQTVAEYRKAMSLYDEDFEITLIGMSENFQKRNVSLLEFVDFFEAYNSVLDELARIRIQLVTSGEELNLIIGKEIY